MLHGETGAAHYKSRMGGARRRGGPQCHRNARGLTAAQNNSTCTDGGQTLPPSLPLCQYNTAIDANKYLCRAQMPEELQGKQGSSSRDSVVPVTVQRGGGGGSRQAY